MFTKTILLATLSILSLPAMADSIDDEIHRIDQERISKLTGTLSPVTGSKSHGKIDSAYPISLKIFRGRSDGWWQAIIKMSDGARVSVNNEFSTISSDWKVIGTKGNTVVVKDGKGEARQLFVDMQLENGVQQQSTTFSNGPGGNPYAPNSFGTQSSTSVLPPLP